MLDLLLRVTKGKDSSIPDGVNAFFDEVYKNPSFIHFEDKGVSVLGIADPHTTVFNDTIYNPENKTYYWVIGDPQPVHKGNTVSTTGGFNSKEEFLELVQNKGHKAFKEFDGEFIIIGYQTNNALLSVITSKLGLLPVFYTSNESEIIISTRLNTYYSILDKPQTDNSAVMQYCLYNYIITEKTFIKDVNAFVSASVYEFKEGWVDSKRYWSVMDELVEKPYGFTDSVNLIDQTLDSVTKRVVSRPGKFAISLTGGWDGRILLAYAAKYLNKEDFLLYSFGTKDAPDVYIPQENAKHLGYKYTPIFLDDEAYQKDLLDWAEKTVYYSDGMRSFKRSHYLYAMSQLAEIADYLYTGIGGSNLIKSNKVAASNVFNSNVIELLTSDEPTRIIENQYDRFQSRYGSLFHNVSLSDFQESFNTKLFQAYYSNYDASKRFLVFLVSDIERKYFGSEIQSYKHLIRNFSPFFEMEFIRALTKTSLFGGYDIKHGLLPGLKNAQFYAKLVHRNHPKLAGLPTDRGFSLSDILFPMNPMLGWKYYKAKKYSKKGNRDYFKNKSLIKEFVQEKQPDKLQMFKEMPENEIISNYFSFLSFQLALNR